MFSDVPVQMLRLAFLTGTIVPNFALNYLRVVRDLKRILKDPKRIDRQRESGRVRLYSNTRIPISGPEFVSTNQQRLFGDHRLVGNKMPKIRYNKLLDSVQQTRLQMCLTSGYQTACQTRLSLQRVSSSELAGLIVPQLGTRASESSFQRLICSLWQHSIFL